MDTDTTAPTLDPSVVAFLEDAGEVRCYDPEAPIIRRGDPGDAFFVVLDGAVEVRLVGDGGRAIPLRRLAAGAFFGEMAILTGDPVSADVVAVAPTRVLAYPAARFPEAMAACQPLQARVVASMASNLRGSSTDVWNLKQRAEALGGLLRRGACAGELVARSKKMRAAAGAMEHLAGDRTPVLVSGETGSGRTFAAAWIHRAAGPGAPLIIVECRDLGEAEARGALLGTAPLGPGADDLGALHRYGAVHLAHGGTLVLRHLDALPAAAQADLARYLELQAAGELHYPDARVIGTVPANGGATLAPALAARFSGGALELPPLRQRRQDILPLARAFLAGKAGDGAPPLSKGAERVLVSRRYQHRNVAELREAVELAALIAGDGEILAEHIFTGPKEGETPLEVDLGRLPAVGWLLQDRVLGRARVGVAAAFGAVIAVCLLGGDSAPGRFANALVWGLWWPGLLLAFLLLGRVWCTVCPLSTVAAWAGRLGRRPRPPAEWLKQHSGWLIAAGFGAVVWAEQVFHMTRNPPAAGLLLLVLAGAAALFRLLYQRETWCRYLCPMGSLGAAYSLPATLSVRANPSVCATCCTTHDCHKGNLQRPGCPVFHHPLYARDGHTCKLCFTCLKSCPHGSARLYLHPPLLRLWRQAEVGGGLTLFALVVFAVAPLNLAAERLPWLAGAVPFTLAAAMAASAAVALRNALPGWLGTAGEPDRGAAGRVALALLLLAWGPAAAFHLGNAPLVRDLAVSSAGGGVWRTLLGDGRLDLLPAVQGAAVALAAALAALALWRIRGGQEATEDEGAAASPVAACSGWRRLGTLCVGYTVTTLALVVIGGCADFAENCSRPTTNNRTPSVTEARLPCPQIPGDRAVVPSYLIAQRQRVEERFPF